MPKISEILAALKNAEQPIEDMDAFIKSVEDAHLEEVSIRDAKVKSVSEEMEKRDKLVTDLKVKNWDLSQQIPAIDSNANSGNNKPEPETKKTGIDAFFTTD